MKNFSIVIESTKALGHSYYCDTSPLHYGTATFSKRIYFIIKIIVNLIFRLVELRCLIIVSTNLLSVS